MNEEHNEWAGFHGTQKLFFIGHREATLEVLPVLEDTIEEYISKYGVSEFVVGNYGGFDHLAARAVMEAKSRHPKITLFLLIPYHPAERPIETPLGFDGTFYPPGMESVPRRYAIIRANRYMIDHTDFLIAYAWHPGSNARNMVEYARRKGVHISNLEKLRQRIDE